MWTYRIVRWILYPFLRLIFWVRIEGLENIPQHGAVIIASKHQHLVDPIFHALCIRRPLRSMAKNELFRGRFMNWLMRLAGAFPVRRGAADKGAIEVAGDLLNEGWAVLIFPEGTRSKTETQEFKPGAALLAATTGAPIIPATIIAKHGYVPFTGMTLRYGTPVTAEELGARKGNSASLRSASAQLRNIVVDLMDEEKTPCGKLS